MWVESTVGAGSTFHFTTRFRREPNGEQPVRRLSPETLHGLPVLAVDDNATNRRILKQMLSNWRMAPTTVADGRAGLELLLDAAAKRPPFRLVLLDFHMPELDGLMVAERVRERWTESELAIILLTSATQQGILERCRTLGIGAYVMKPFTQSELLDAISSILIREDEVVESRLEPSDAAGDNEKPAIESMAILIAEDHPVNQRLALRLLEKQGHRVTVAGSGKEAIDAFRRQRFDAILMDVQMPELDGIEATRAIRLLEGREGRPRTPIIALTARAMSRDREVCLEAGMDGYVSKPLRPNELCEALERVLQL